jgi:CRISPR-associated Csx11 family protein
MKMKNNKLDILEKNRNALLLAEIGCWIHMLGKFDKEFLISQAYDDGEYLKKSKGSSKEIKKYDYRRSFLDKLPPDLKDLITGRWVISPLSSLPNLPDSNNFPSNFSLFEFSKEHTNRDSQVSILRLLVDAHGVASGIEKGTAIEESKQFITETFISTAFGHEYKNVINLNWSNIQNPVYNNLVEALTKIKSNKANLPEEKWWELIIALRKHLKSLFSKTLAETRRPLNHISLFDQTVSTVAFYKADLARVALTKWHDPITYDFDKKYKFQLLRIPHNGMDFWSESDTIGDLLARKGLINDIANYFEKLLTSRYPLGYLAYKDENDIIFLLPDEPKDILSLTHMNSTLKDMICEKVSQITKSELIPSLYLQKEENRWAANIGDILEADIGEPRIDIAKIKTLWEGKTNEICVVCRIRPQGKSEKAKMRKVCDICLDRRKGRCKDWSTNLETTIWMDEICDINGRIALIVGKLDTKNWLNGKLVNSVLGRLLPSVSPDWKKEVKYIEIVEGIKTELSERNIGIGTPLLHNFIKGTNVKSGLRNKEVKKLYEVLVTNREGGGPPLSDTPQTENAEHLFQAIFAQEPSFTRIQRIWETTRQFWQDILPTTEDILSKKDIPSETKDILGTMGPRLLITGSIPSGKTPSPYHAYELLIDGTKLSVVWDQTLNGFILIENVAYIAQVLGHKFPERKDETTQKYQKKLSTWALSKIQEYIKGELHIEEPLGYGAPDKEWGTIIVKNVKEIPDSEYIPAIPILAEPSTFIALVPADKALNVVKMIREKYNTEMGKVKNRLPLHIGIIFTHRHTPLRVIMDAGQRMLRFHTEPEPWEVTSIKSGIPHTSSHFKEMVQIHIETNTNNNIKTLQWDIPLKMGDGTTDDNWYPYAFLKSWEGTTPEERTRSLKTVAPWNTNPPQFVWLVHVSDLEIGDTIYFTPSTIDFEWLDTSSRRFEIAYKEGTFARVNNISRPYLLDTLEPLEEIWNTLKTSLKNSQIYAVRDIIQRKEKEWNCKDKTFEQFCRNTIAVAEWISSTEGYPWEKEKIPKKEWLNKWAHYAVEGLLCDAIELHMHIIKEKSQAGGD